MQVLARTWGLAVILALAVAFSADPPYRSGPPIRSDGVGYHAWTWGFVKREFGFCHLTVLQQVGALSATNPRHPGRCTNQWAPGLALLRLPVMALLIDTSPRDYAISDAEHEASLWMGAAALLIACGFILATCLMLGVRPLVANLVVLAACFGTGLFHYATYDGSYTHVYSAALVAALVWLGVRAARARRMPSIVAVALLAFFIALVRQPNIPVLLVLLAGWLVWQVRPLTGRARTLAALRSAVPLLGGIVVAVSIQLVYNRWSSGHWAISSYVDEEMKLSYLKQRPVLLSYERGLFTWYPAVLVLLVAALATKRARGWGWVAAGSIAALTLIYGSWHSWPLGAGFGHRGFVEIVPIVAVAGAYALGGLRSRLAIPALAALTLCTLATVELMTGYWRDTIPIANTTPDQYWSHVIGRESLLH